VGRNLKQKLRGELRGILNWAVNGLSRLQDNNWKMTEAQGFQAGMASIREYTDVVKGFLEENYEFIGEIT
jgi:putative DNA primase/helicase